MNLAQFKIFLYRYINKKSSEEESRLFDDFFEYYQEQESSLTTKQQQEIKVRILTNINKQLPNKKTIVLVPRFMKVAAALLVLIASALLAYQFHWNAPSKSITIITCKAEQKNIVLEDGTHVMLNADSRLTYPEFFDKGKRQVYLEGEAFFEVKKDTSRPFFVTTSSVQTEVLGTSFNVSAYGGELPVVTVATGKVKVSTLKNAKENNVILKADQQASLQPDQTLTVNHVPSKDYMAWKSGVIYLKDATLPGVAVKLERKYNIHVEMKQFLQNDKCRFNGSLADDKLTNVLENLRFISGLDYTIVNDTTVLINNVSCN